MIEDRPILAIETSQSLCSVCVYFSKEKFFEIDINLKNSHAEKLFELIELVIKSSSIEVDQLGAIAVSTGPGSFTGLRIGMSAAKGIAFGASLPIVPVPTFESLALKLSDFLPDETEFIIANKINAEEVYFAKFKIKQNSYVFIEELKVTSNDDFQKKLNGVLLFGNASLNLDHNKNDKKIRIASPNARYVAMWYKKFGDNLLSFDYDYLEPNYLKNFIIKERYHA